MPEHIFRSPVAPGDPLWRASSAGDAGSGPALVQACRSRKPVEAVMFSGGNVYAVSDGESRDKLGTRYACVDKASCVAWIRENMPGSVLMDGRTVTAVHIGPDGRKEPVSLECTVNAVEALFGSSDLATDAPDAAGTFAVYRKDASPDTASITTFIQDSRGNPVRALYGELLLMRAEPSGQPEYEGLLLPAGLPEQILSAINDEGDAGRDAPAYDPSAWTSCRGLRLGAFKKFLSQFPDDAVLCCCGTDQVFLHWCPGTKSLNVDCEGMEDLPEYEGRAPAALGGLEP